MNVQIQVPVLPESVADATVATWHKRPGDAVKRDETVVDLETDKVVLEVPAPADGVMGEILHKEGAVVKSGEALGTLRPPGTSAGVSQTAGQSSTLTNATKAAAPQALGSTMKPPPPASTQRDAVSGVSRGGPGGGPAARRLAAEQRSSASSGVTGLQAAGGGAAGIAHRDTQGLSSSAAATSFSTKITTAVLRDRVERRVPMSRLRAMIAKRLVEVQRTAAILTTFNEINLAKVMELRAAYKEGFEKRHGVRLGLMSFFTKAVVETLKYYPAVNASIDGDDVIYYDYFDIGIAVSTDRGLMVPIVRDADKLSFAEIEKSIANYAHKAKDNQIAIEDMTGGTFTITNGGVFGSLLATPIINPPQSAILGMHKIEDRAVVEGGQIVIRPMMYVALSYDHRIIDGRESIGFLNKIKEFLEEPARLLIDV